MSYTRAYKLDVKANPTMPGVVTAVKQRFDGSQLTDRYLKQLTNGLRHRVLPAFGGMFQLAVMCAEHIGVQPPVGITVRQWSAPIVRQGHGSPLNPKHQAWTDLMKLSSVRSKLQHAQDTEQRLWRSEAEEPHIAAWGCLYLPGWQPSERKAFVEAVHEATAKLPNYTSDMEKLAQFIESRPSFDVMDAELGIVAIRNRTATLAERKSK